MSEILRRQVPDQVLESHTCRICNNYLTVSPITVHPEGGNICGRCDIPLDKSSLFECSNLDLPDIPYTILGYVNHLFPCINRFEGCHQLLSFNEIGAHELSCKTKKRTLCKICKRFEGSGSQQVNHFKSLHPGNVFDNRNIHVSLERNSSYLIKRGGQLFFMDVEMLGTQVNFYVESSSFDEIDFFCLLKDTKGDVIDQTTSSRRGIDGIHHCIVIKGYDCLRDVHCECLLRFRKNLQ